MAKFRQKSSTKISVGDSFFIIYMSLLEKSSTYDPSSLPNKVGFLSILLATALIRFYWKADLLSYLFTRKTVLPFRSLNDMYYNAPDFRLALVPWSAWEDDFKYSINPVWQNIYQEMLQPYLDEYSNYKNPTDMIDFIKNDDKIALYSPYHTIRCSSKTNYRYKVYSSRPFLFFSKTCALVCSKAFF